MPRNTETSEDIIKRIEDSTKTLEKEKAFFTDLLQAKDSLCIVNRIVLLIPIFKMIEEDIPLYVADRCESLFSYKPIETTVVLSLLLEEIVRTVRLSAYLCIKGVFPQGVSVLRQAVELIGVYTHIWHTPQKIEFVELDSDSQDYGSAFRFTKDKALQSQLKIQGVQYRFSFCRAGKILSETYSFLSSNYVHAGSLKNAVFGSVKDDSLSCYYVDRASPNDLDGQYKIVQGVLTAIFLELLGVIPIDDTTHEHVAHLKIIMGTLLPILSNPEETVEPEMAALMDVFLKAVAASNIGESSA